MIMVGKHKLQVDAYVLELGGINLILGVECNHKLLAIVFKNTQFFKAPINGRSDQFVRNPRDRV